MFAVPANTVASTVTPPTAHPALIARAVADDRSRWGHLLRYDPDGRFAALVERTAEQEIWLMSWLPGQDTGRHDHGDTTGAFTVVSGVLTEEVLRGGLSVSHELVIGQSRVFAPGYAHRVRNTGPDPAITVHVYRSARTIRSVT